MTSQQIFTIVFQLVLTGGIGIITYFLKRTMDDIDKCKSGLDKVRENYVSKDEFDKCKTDITDGTILPKRIFTENSLRLNRSWTRSWIS